MQTANMHDKLERAAAELLKAAIRQQTTEKVIGTKVHTYHSDQKIWAIETIANLTGTRFWQGTPFVCITEETYERITCTLDARAKTMKSKQNKTQFDFRVWKATTTTAKNIYAVDVATDKTINEGRIERAKRPLETGNGGSDKTAALGLIEKNEFREKEVQTFTMFASKGPISEDGKYRAMKNSRVHFWKTEVRGETYYTLASTAAAKDKAINLLQNENFKGIEAVVAETKRANNTVWVYMEAHDTKRQHADVDASEDDIYANIEEDLAKWREWTAFISSCCSQRPQKRIKSSIVS